MFSSLLQSFRKSPGLSASARADRARPLRERLSTLLDEKRSEEAVTLLEQLGSMEPKSPRWPHKCGDLLHQLRRDDQAFIAYATAVRLYADSGYPERARAMAKAALAAIPAAERLVIQLDPVTQAAFCSVGLHGTANMPVVL